LNDSTSERAAYIGPYLLLGILGKGGMGIVYRAVDTRTGTFAAVKTLQRLSEAVLSSFRREIKSLARIHHPGIVRILDEGVHNGVPWYAMAYVEGRTLRLHATGTIGDIVQTADMPGGAGPSAPQSLTLGVGASQAMGGNRRWITQSPELLR
jgi:serine/threonine protein kinase